MIDLHSHILPGFDDGARTLDDAFAIARDVVRDGTHTIAATPHVRRDYPTSADAMERGVEDLQAALDGEGIELRVVRGGEIALPELEALPGEELRRFGLGGSACVLLETPYVGWPLAFPQTVETLVADGVTPVIAHPERNTLVQEDVGRVRELVDAGALVQVTAGSLDGRLGDAPRSCARKLVAQELAHLLASDAHAPGVRQAGLTAARDKVGDAELARWLTETVPAAMLAGEPLPPRPPLRARRFAGLRRRARREGR